jgi:hypothetical protein
MSAAAPEADLDVSQIVLDVVNKQIRGLDTRIDGSITDGSLERTIEGASTLTLTVHDPARVLLQSGAFGYAIDIRLDRLFWRLVKVSKQDDDLTLTFEDREVALLRQGRTPKKASRAKVTRAEFALSLVREVRSPAIPFVCPELHVRQAVEIATDAQGRTSASRATQKQKGLNRAAALTVKGVKADTSQLQLSERILDVADSLNAGNKPTLALMCACIVESLIRNLSGGDRDSRGVLQVRDSTARSMGINNRDVAACANAFLRRGFTGRGGAIQIARENPGWTAGQIAQAVQGSAFPGRYNKVSSEAQAFVNAYSGAGANAPTTQTKTLPYQFRRGNTDGTWETSWACLQRLAEEVNWRCFMSAGSLYFISDLALMKAKPRLILTEASPGVLGIDFDIDAGKKAQECTVTARAARWAAAPGAVVELDKCGPANGRWLVKTISRGLFDANATITLIRPSQPLKEPAPDTTTVTSSAAAASSSIGGSQGARAYQAAQAMTSKRYPYVWGGGHGAAGSPTGSPAGFDCSGSTVAVLAAAGMGYRLGGPVDVSGTIAATWGVAGKGQQVTVYANAQHVFMVFHTDQGDRHFGTGDWGKGWDGAGFNPRLHPTSGFQARHWPGT